MRKSTDPHLDPSTGWTGTSYSDGSLGLTVWMKDLKLHGFSLRKQDGNYLSGLEWYDATGFDARRWNLSEVDVAQYSRLDAGVVCGFFLTALGESPGDVDRDIFSDIRAKLTAERSKNRSR